MSSKIIGSQGSDFFANIAVDAILSVKRVDPLDPTKAAKYPVNSVNIIKTHGKSALESMLLHGYCLPGGRASQQMPRIVKGAKIALLDFNLQRHRMALGIQVTVSDPAKLEAIRQREADITKERIEKILKSGANVVFTTKAIDDLCLKYLVEGGVIGVRRCKKEDLKRIAVATGGTLLPNLADLEGEESFDASALGTAEEVAEERVGDGELIYIRGTPNSKAVSIVLRGANEFLLDEMERSLHDTLCVVQRVLESKALVAGGGAVEAAVAMYLDTFATTLGSKEQLAIKEFGEALLVIPRTLAVNAAQDATELVAKLCAYHHTAQTSDDRAEFRFYGLDLVNGKVVNSLRAGVVEPAMSKLKSLRFATEAAITILRIDDFIKINKQEQQKGGR
jgi:T-complex protein 1 subunit alpha